MTKQQEPKDVPFEKAYARLEEILKTMNDGATSLEDSLKLFEEATLLINTCNHKLKSAEEKIESLLKTQDGSLLLDETGIPKKEPFFAFSNGAL